MPPREACTASPRGRNRPATASLRACISAKAGAKAARRAAKVERIPWRKASEWRQAWRKA